MIYIYIYTHAYHETVQWSVIERYVIRVVEVWPPAPSKLSSIASSRSFDPLVGASILDYARQVMEDTLPPKDGEVLLIRLLCNVQCAAVL